MPEFEFHVEGRPVPKERPRFGRGRTFTAGRTCAWETHVRVVAMAACARARWKADPGTYRIHVWVRRAQKRGDLDNFCKAVLDACNGVVFPDDRHVYELHLAMSDDKDHPGVTVRAERL